MSEEDIAKGRRPTEVISDALERATLGIICLTPENIDSRWILFETGALANSLDARDAVCPILLELEKKDVRPPISQFQLTSLNKKDLLRLVRSINERLPEVFQADANSLERRFEKWWPDLQPVLKEVSEMRAPGPETERRSVNEVVEEILDTVRRTERTLGERRESSTDQGSNFPSAYRTGMRVRHPTFGEGIITDREGAGKNLKLTVDFDRANKKRLLAQYAGLEIIPEDDLPF